MRETFARVVDAHEHGLLTTGECVGTLIERCRDAEDAKSMLAALPEPLRAQLCEESKAIVASGTPILHVSSAGGTHDLTERMLAGAQLVFEASSRP
jgi:hypothetical protein